MQNRPESARSRLLPTEALHVVERFTRSGDTIAYQATGEDPNVLTRPWVMNPRTRRLGTRPLEEGPPCVEKDADDLVSNEHLLSRTSTVQNLHLSRISTC